MKFCMHVYLLCGQVFSPLVNIGSQKSRGQRYNSSPWLRSWHRPRHHLWSQPWLDRQIVLLSSMVMTVGGHLQLRVAALLKTTWWRMRVSCKHVHGRVYITANFTVKCVILCKSNIHRVRKKYTTKFMVIILPNVNWLPTLFHWYI